MVNMWNLSSASRTDGNLVTTTQRDDANAERASRAPRPGPESDGTSEFAPRNRGKLRNEDLASELPNVEWPNAELRGDGLVSGISGPDTMRNSNDLASSNIVGADTHRGAAVQSGPSRSLLLPANWNSAIAPTIANGLQRFAPWLGCVWLGGLILAALRPMIGLAFQGTMSHRDANSNQRLDRVFRNAYSLMQPLRQVRAAIADNWDVPAVFGFWRPLVLVPLSSINGLSTRELEAVLLHELAHVRRFDDIANLLQTATETMLFFHPVIWWLSAVARQERENCCDDLAVQRGGHKTDLARALFKIENGRGAGIAHGMAFNGGSTLQRIRRLVSVQPQELSLPRWAGLMVLTIVTLIGLGGIPVSGWGGAAEAVNRNTWSDTEEDFSSLNFTGVQIRTSGESPLGQSKFFSSDPVRIKELQRLFPEAGFGRRGQEPAGWVADVVLEFTSDEAKVEVMLSTSQKLWSEGQGDWDLPEELGEPLCTERIVGAQVTVAANAAKRLVLENDNSEWIIEDDRIVKVQPVARNQILVTGLRPGTTGLTVKNSQGEARQFRIQVGLTAGQDAATPGSRGLLTQLAELEDDFRREAMDPTSGRQDFATLEELESLPENSTSLRYTGRRDWGDGAIEDSWLKLIATRFSQLRHLEIPEARKVTTAGFQELTRLAELSTLRLRFADIADGAEDSVELAKQLAAMPNLKILDVSYSRGLTSDRAVAELTKGGLEYLVVVRHAKGGVEAAQIMESMGLGVHRIFVSRAHNLFDTWQGLPAPWREVQDMPGTNYYMLAVKDALQALEQQRLFRRVRWESAANNRCLQQNQERLANELQGQWVAIVDGQLLPGFDSMHAASEAADKVKQDAVHRYIFQAGANDAPTEFDTSPWSTRPTWHQVGRAFRRQHGINVSVTQWSTDTGSLDAGDAGALLFLSSPATAADGEAWQLPSKPNSPLHLQQPFVPSSLLQQQATLPADDAILMNLYRYSVPGTVRSTAYRVDCAKVRVRIAEPKLGIDEVVTAFVIPIELTSKYK